VRPGQDGRALERLLAAVYTDPAALERFLADPAAEARRMGCAAEEAEGLRGPDEDGLRLAHDSFRRKRAMKASPTPWWRRLLF
jgi:hypothetical protein